MALASWPFNCLGGSLHFSLPACYQQRLQSLSAASTFQISNYNERPPRHSELLGWGWPLGSGHSQKQAWPCVCGVASTRPSPLASPGHGGRESLHVKDLSVLQSFCDDQRTEPAGGVTQPQLGNGACPRLSAWLPTSLPFLQRGSHHSHETQAHHCCVLVCFCFPVRDKPLGILLFLSPCAIFLFHPDP